MVPTLQSLWLVDAVELDSETGKVSLSGLFNRVDVPADADYAAGATIFFSLRGVHGEVRLTLLYVDLLDDAALLERPIRIEGQPLETTDVSVRVNQIPVPHPGSYAWELFYGAESLGSARIDVVVAD